MDNTNQALNSISNMEELTQAELEEVDGGLSIFNDIITKLYDKFIGIVKP
ncbi:hypothetical protein R2R35_12735 [Anaerocolumna sp. AGMB13020]|nr:hypothetical protein [Anaerocolumna sp. AGMB13020]WOO34666.1 hypothetical protein R2R35_12735 [Anaerocolumna sp. AGMB13020]